MKALYLFVFYSITIDFVRPHVKHFDRLTRLGRVLYMRGLNTSFAVQAERGVTVEWRVRHATLPGYPSKCCLNIPQSGYSPNY